MSFQRQISQALDDEHRASLEFLTRLDAFARALRGDAARDPEVQRLATTLVRHLDLDIPRHFDFEERELFPRMDAGGDSEMASLLLEEHAAIRAVCGEIEPLARAASAGTLGDAECEALKRGALELVERLASHIEKETMALLPLVDDLLDDETDRELAFAYAAA